MKQDCHKHNIYYHYKNCSIKKKIALFGICLLLQCINESVNIHLYLQNVGYHVSRIEYIFYLLYSGSYMPYTSLLFLLLLGNMKRRKHNNRRLYVFYKDVLFASFYAFIGVVFLSLCVVLLSLFLSNSGLSWMNLSTFGEEEKAMSLIPVFVLESLTPFSASLLALLVIYLFWFMTGLFLSIMYKLKLIYVGIMLYIVGIFWDGISFSAEVSYMAPVRYFTLQALIEHSEQGAESMSIVYGVLSLIIGIVILIALNCAIVYMNKRSTWSKTA